MEKLNIASGTLYPLLRRLERGGWTETEDEDVDPSKAGRPARRYVRLTEEGRYALRQIEADNT